MFRILKEILHLQDNGPVSEGVTIAAGTLAAITFTAKADLTEEQASSFELVKSFVYDNS